MPGASDVPGAKASPPSCRAHTLQAVIISVTDSHVTFRFRQTAKASRRRTLESQGLQFTPACLGLPASCPQTRKAERAHSRRHSSGVGRPGSVQAEQAQEILTPPTEIGGSRLQGPRLTRSDCMPAHGPKGPSKSQTEISQRRNGS